jgi:hypothetical protein
VHLMRCSFTGAVCTLLVRCRAFRLQSDLHCLMCNVDSLICVVFQYDVHWSGSAACVGTLFRSSSSMSAHGD